MINFIKKYNKKMIICVGLFLSMFMCLFGFNTKVHAAAMMTGNIYGGVIWDDTIAGVQSHSHTNKTITIDGAFKTYRDYNDSSTLLPFNSVSFTFDSIGELKRVRYFEGNSLVMTYMTNGNITANACPYFWIVDEYTAVPVLIQFEELFETFVTSTPIDGLLHTYPGHVFGLSISDDAELVQQLQTQISELTIDNSNLQNQVGNLTNLVNQQNILIESLRTQLASSSKDIYAWSTISFCILINDPGASSGYSYYYGEFNQNGNTQEKDTLKFDVKKFFATKEIDLPDTPFGDGTYFKVHFWSNTLYNAVKYPIYYNVKNNQFLNIYNLPSGIGTSDMWSSEYIQAQFSFDNSLYDNTLIYDNNTDWNGLEIGIKSLDDGYIIDLKIGNIYQQGYDNGFVNGQYTSSLTIQNLEQEINNLKSSNANLLKTIEDLSNDKNSFLGLFMGIGNIPGNIMSSMLNFEILGINLLGLVTGLLSALLLIWLIKKLI